MWGFLPHHQTLNSFMIYPKIASAATGYGLGPGRWLVRPPHLQPTADANRKCEESPVSEGYRGEVPATATWGSDNLQKWLRELRELTRLLIYDKSPKLRNSQMKRCSGRGLGKRGRFRALQVPRVHQPGSAPNPLLLGFYGGVIAQTRTDEITDPWRLPQPPATLPPPGQGTQRPAPPLEAFQSPY